MATFQPDHHGNSSGPHPGDVPRQWLVSMNIIVGAMAGALALLAVVLAVIGAELVTPETWMLGLVALATLVSWAVVLVLRTPLPRNTPVQPTAQATVMLRVALLEAPAILGLVLAFLAEPVNLLPYLLPAAFSLLGIWLFARPRVVLKQLSRPR